MQTVSAKASTPTQRVTIVRTPLEMKTVIAPKVSGIAAAIGDRKTSSRTISRIGRAISSARSLAEIDSSWRALERVGNPDWVALTGGLICLFEDFFEFVDALLDRGRDRGVEVGDHQRLVR